MPFSSLSDPADLARAQSAFYLVWLEIVAGGHVSETEQAGRDGLAEVIIALLPSCADEAELVELAVERFAQLKVEF